MKSSCGSRLYQSALTLGVLTIIEARAHFRSNGFLLVFFLSVFFFFATCGILALSHWRPEDSSEGHRAAVEHSLVGQPILVGILPGGLLPKEAPSEFPLLGDFRSAVLLHFGNMPSGTDLPVIGISMKDARHIGAVAKEELRANGSAIEDLGAAGDEAFFEKARSLGKLPAAVIHLQDNRLGQAQGVLRMGAEFTSAERMASLASLKKILAAIGRDRAQAAGHAEPSRYAAIDGIATAAPKESFATPAAKAAAGVASHDKALRLAFGILSSMAAWISAALGIVVAKRRSARGEFECFAASPCKAWSLALSLPIGAALTAALLIAFGILAAAVFFADAQDFPIALQACLALAIQALAFSCWEALVLSLAIKKQLLGLLGIAPAVYLLHHVRMAMLDSAGGPSGAISALMSDHWAAWSHAASLYAAAAIAAAALAHWRIGPGCRKTWQAKPT